MDVPAPVRAGAVPLFAAGPTVAAVAADPALGLRVVVGGAGMARVVQAAHTSELRDPAPWLRGGELLMTTGLALGADPAALAAYVERLAAAGVACLALGVGSGLTHTEVPGVLVDAARACGLPLLEVPEPTPFLAVTESVFSRLATARYAEQARALDAQRVLTAAAVHPGGTPAVAGALSALTGLSVLVTGALGEPLADAGGDRGRLSADLAGELDRLRPHGLHATASVLVPGRDVRVQPLGARQLRGFLVCGGVAPPGPFERQLVAAAVVLLTLELERLRGAGDADRRRRSDVAAALVATELPDAAAGALLTCVGLRADAVRGVVLHLPPDADPEQVVDRLGRRLPGLLALHPASDLVLLVGDPPADLLDVVEAAADRAPAGLGTPVRPGAAARSVRQARQAAAVAAGHGSGAVDVLDLPGLRLLLALEAGAPGAVAAYARSVLGPLEEAGPRGGALQASLRAFLEHDGSWQRAAAHLGVHRHTLRERLRRVEELTGRRLDSSHDRMELLLAFEAGDLALPG